MSLLLIIFGGDKHISLKEFDWILCQRRSKLDDFSGNDILGDTGGHISQLTSLIKTITTLDELEKVDPIFKGVL